MANNFDLFPLNTFIDGKWTESVDSKKFQVKNNKENCFFFYF
jgi:hypothetical protein